MSHTVLQALDIVRTVSLLALVIACLKPNAAWSRKARLPVALVAFVSSAAHLILTIV